MKFTEGRRAADSSIGRISDVTKTAASFGSQPLEQTTVDKTSEGESQGTGPDTDSVGLTTDNQLAPAARDAAAAPVIRQHKVEAARKAIDAGTLGNDLQALAEKIIESMLKR